MESYLGLDFGTSGARVCVVDKVGAITHEDHIFYPDAALQIHLNWREALHTLLKRLPATVAAELQSIVIAATSATVLLCNKELEPTAPALLYFDNRAQEESEQLKQLAPSGHIVCSASSGLAKFLWLTKYTELSNVAYFLHQADWLAALLTGLGGISDYHNALKSGYDTERLCWPDWIKSLPHANLLPQVVAPGANISNISSLVAQHFKINPACRVHAGTTDSIAAFIAAGVHEPGSAVTSLGTTMVLKLLSEQRVEAAQYGVYSHRFGDLWLAGGASNAGGGVLRQYFGDLQIDALSQRIDPAIDSPLDYYPLPRPGERFPINDPTLTPRLTPRPADDVLFLHGLLQGLSRIETAGYTKLAELGASPLKSVITTGGGAKNKVWRKIRERLLGIPVSVAEHTESAYGAALLAKRGLLIGNL
jgi:D-ribulokinase